ncbi:hypothetical protein SAMN05216532_0494 [Streptomyces sp. 2231.1]|nr:hypothetical protein SAMN05216532_0494 [Streptomyces sp. 2231.1]
MTWGYAPPAEPPADPPAQPDQPDEPVDPSTILENGLTG